jgi:hypothetical protein
MGYIMHYITTNILNIILYWQYQFILARIWTINNILLYYYIDYMAFI